MGVLGGYGELDPSELTVSFNGSIVCDFCSINQEMDVNNERNIDARVNIDFK